MLKPLLKELKFTPLHLLLWVGVWLFYSYFFSYGSNNEDFVFWFSTSLLPVTAAITYFISYLLIPKYLIPKKYVQFSLYLLYTVVCSIYLILIITFVNLIFLSDFSIRKMPLLTRNVVFVLILVYLVVCMVCFVQLLRYNHKTSNRNKELENKLLEGKLLLKQKELHYLKQQIHPHFLFNTLNNLYALTLKKSDLAPEIVLKLSEMMRYMLYECNERRVPLSKEVNYLKNYLELEKLRQGKNIKTNLIVQGEIGSQMIAPLMFIPFVENSFKHGISDSISEGYVNIEILISDQDLQINIVNSKITRLSPPNKIKSGGIGLVNIRRRLNLIYPEEYILDIQDSPNEYRVELGLTLVH